MASTKTTTVIFNGVTLTAGNADTSSNAVDLTDGYGASINVKLVNGATGPTLPAQVQIQVSADGTNYYNFCGPLVGGVANAGSYTWGGVDIPIGVKYIKLVAGSNTDQNVTVTADIAEVVSVA